MNNLSIRNNPVAPLPQPQVQQGQVPQGAGKFRDILQQTIGRQDGVRFSSHAMDRLSSRGINLSNQDIVRLNDAVGKAENKGSRDSLVLMNDMAFVVSVKNKTVVTAMTGPQMRDNVFTNIDSTVMA